MKSLERFENVFMNISEMLNLEILVNFKVNHDFKKKHSFNSRDSKKFVEIHNNQHGKIVESCIISDCNSIKERLLLASLLL